MKQNLPWSVSGISPEARDAARAAAQREGMSVGDWLTRRILDEASARAFEEEAARAEQENERTFTQRPLYRAERNADTRRDRDDLVARIARAEAETESAFRRIDETLRSMTRRLETTERSQNEASRAMGLAAAEINAATRDQTQAFSNLAERIDHVEHHADDGALKDAVRGLHQGLSKLADQIARTANESSTQVSSLAANVETLAGKVAATREEAIRSSQTLEARVATLAERVKVAEEASDGATKALRTALGMFESRLTETEPKTAEAERTAQAVQNLENTVAQIAERLTMAESRAGAAEEKVQETLTRQLSAIERGLDSIVQRLDAGEKQHREALSELRTNLNDTGKRVDALARPALAPLATAPVFDLPPFAEPPPMALAPAAFTPAPSPPPPVSDIVPPPPLFEVVPDAELEPPPSAVPSASDYIAAARRAAAEAAAEAQSQRTARGGALGSFRDATGTMEEEARSGVGRKVMIAAAVLLLIAILAGVLFTRGFNTRTDEETVEANKAVGQLFNPNRQGAPAPKSAEPTQNHAATTPKSEPPLPARPLTRDGAVGDLLVAPGTPSVDESTAPSPPEAVEISPQATAAPPASEHAAARSLSRPQQSASLDAAPQKSPETETTQLDRLLAKAKAGNLKAELVLGIQYLEGGVIAANMPEALQWLKKAAARGEAIAEYRLGTMYERGRGVPADVKQAHAWYEQAARHGNRKAMHNLAVSFAQGTGTEKNFQQAAHWFKAAAELGLVDSQFNLAVLYERGMGVTPSLRDAYTWYAIAAAQGDGESKTRLEALATQISPADKQAAEKTVANFHQQKLNLDANEPPTIAQVVP